jgi:hypothetical protein
MTRARIYPPANRTAQWWEDNFDRATMARIDKLLLHSTETASWPGYKSGANAPTLTYNPWIGTKASDRWRQHNYLNTSARALLDPSSTPVRENRDGVVQVEIIGYCDPKLAAKYGHFIRNLPDHAYQDLGALLAFLHLEHGVPLVRAAEWLTYPASGRADSPIRMTSAQYDAFRGVLGHQHASGNTHGDPGMTNVQVDRILAAAKRLTKPAPAKPPVQEDPMAGITLAQIQSVAKTAAKEAITEYMAGLYEIKRNGTAAKNHAEVEGLLREVLRRQGLTDADVDAILAEVRAVAGQLAEHTAEDAPKA